jgi:hypothetical protein
MSELELAVVVDKAEAASEKEIIKCAKDLKGLLERGSISERRSFIRSFVKAVRISGDQRD